ncbi:N-acetylglucosaminyl-diphospho-decaprenol L-rhamnosyltransferase [Paenibacillus solanacearum]|uniref:N-acetylglucosaminyl-diphospho-decaprenol L-rhamnosyltransferase n=1 Tax=Paenibacillus solanacearum TaxID=2048548 RepID=A0A916K658_9BACL|nr:glycosyltransferase family 2 protein [Paenibacillus solanacearum]CAG7647703.1 N-acetylglucosaminyl-diphospho-decaprenol L-rhamnosyltransferase [Paenibacillus solanacearum]
MDLSIIVVNYNTRELTLNCLESIFDSETCFKYEVVLVDNHSTDSSVDAILNQYPDIKLICNHVNLGYSKANNQGICMAQGRYILLLNSDTIVQRYTLETMIRFMDHNLSVGAAGCKIILPDGSLDRACRRGFPTPSASFYYAFGISKLFPSISRFNQYQLSHLDPDKDYPVDCLVGAFMMVRRKVIEQVGLLDEEFFMYGEDIDWCYRIKQARWGIYYYPYTHIVHYKGASSRRKPLKIIYEFHRAMFLFHKKHFRKKYSFLINGLVYAGISAKLLMALLLNRFGSVR